MKKLLLVLMLLASTVFAVDPWVRPMPTMVRTVNVHSQADLDTWYNSGPLVGDYVEIYPDVSYTGYFNITQHDVVIRGHDHAILTGGIDLQGTNIWVRDMHLIRTGQTTIMNVYWSNDAVVNCVLEGDYVSDNSVGIFLNSLGGSNKLIYGNIIRGKKHNLYVQHKTSDTYMYVVHNYIADRVPNANPVGYNVHEYGQSTEGGVGITGKVQYIQNAIANGGFFIGGQNTNMVPFDNVLKENVLSNSAFTLGYKRPQGTDLISNFAVNTPMLVVEGDGGTLWQGDGGDTDPSLGIADNFTFTGNTIYNTTTDHFGFFTSRYVNGVRQDGIAPIRANDTWDGNSYYGSPFGVSFKAGNSGLLHITTIADWRNKSEAAGKRLGVNDTVFANAPSARYWLYVNSFDPDKALLILWGVNNVHFPIHLTSPKIAPVNDPYNYVSPTALIGAAGQVSVYRVKW